MASAMVSILEELVVRNGRGHSAVPYISTCAALLTLAGVARWDVQPQSDGK